MSSYLCIYGVLRKKEGDAGEQPPVMLLCYSRNTPVYQTFYEEIHPAYCGNDEPGEPMSHTVLTPEMLKDVELTLCREMQETADTLNKWYGILYGAVRGRRVSLPGEPGDEPEEEEDLPPEDACVDVGGEGFREIYDWIETYSTCLEEYRGALENISAIRALVQDSTNEYQASDPWYQTFEKIICNVD